LRLPTYYSFIRDGAAPSSTTSDPYLFNDSGGQNRQYRFSRRLEELKRQHTSAPTKPPVWNGEGGSVVAQAIIAHNFSDDELDRLTSILREIAAGFTRDTDANDCNRRLSW
jgi:hypothetical protein